MPSEKIAPPLWQRNLLFAVVCLAGVGAVVSNLLKSDTMAARFRGGAVKGDGVTLSRRRGF